jgi:hypothetical protein
MKAHSKADNGTLFVGGLGLVSLFIVSAASALPNGVVKGIFMLIVGPVTLITAAGLSCVKLWRISRADTSIPKRAWLILGLVSALVAALVLVFTVYEATGA